MENMKCTSFWQKSSVLSWQARPGKGESENAACQSPVQREAAFVSAEDSKRRRQMKVIAAGRRGLLWGAVEAVSVSTGHLGHALLLLGWHQLLCRLLLPDLSLDSGWLPDQGSCGWRAT